MTRRPVKSPLFYTEDISYVVEYNRFPDTGGEWCEVNQAPVFAMRHAAENYAESRASFFGTDRSHYRVVPFTGIQ